MTEDLKESDSDALRRIAHENINLRKALEEVFSIVSYVNIHGVGEQPEPTGEPQPMRVSPEEFRRLFQKIGTTASEALN